MENINQDKKLLIIWIDNNINNQENQAYLSKLKIRKINYEPGLTEDELNIPNEIPYNIFEFDNIQFAIAFIKNLRFKETIIIISGRLFTNFIKILYKNLKYIYIIPEVIVFTSQMKNFYLPNEIEREHFFSYRGATTSFDNVINYINKQQKIHERFLIQNQQIITYNARNQPIDEKLIFEPIKDRKDLMLPMFYQTLLDVSKQEENNNFIKSMFNEFQNDPKYNGLLKQINILDVSVELLSKYFVRMYTIEGKFYKKMKMDLLDDNNAKYFKYLPYIKTLYEGLKKGALKTCVNIQLYGAQFLSNQEIIDLQIYKQNRIKDLPMSIVFSKSFISFSKDINVAEYFYEQYHKNAMFTVVNVETDFNILTHADIEELSNHPEEREVLFFPFSAFGLDDFWYDPVKNRYNVKLIYLGKFLKEFKKDNKFMSNKDNLPNNHFKNLFQESGLAQNDKINNINNNQIYKMSQEQGLIDSSNKECNKICWIIIGVIAALIILIYYVVQRTKSNDLQCGGGFYLDEDSEECAPCQIGYYSETGDNTCTRCPYGQSSDSNSSTCYLCPAGTISNKNYEYCVNCSAGYFSKEGSSSCQLCPGGTFSEIGAGECSYCEAGYYSSAGSKTCMICNEGTYSEKGASKCLSCPDGTYSNIKGAVSCNKCPAGTFSNYYNTYNTYCVNCSKGYYSNITGATKCTKCPDGSISDITGATSCEVCPAGTYQYYINACSKCSLGYYSDKPGVTKCTKCPDGSISDITGATSCTVCPAGTYQYYINSCSKCSLGEYSNITGATKCEKCPDGSISDITGATSCSVCPAGTYQYYINSCSKCPKGEYSNKPGVTKCEKCPEGKTTNGIGATYCE